MNEPKPANCDPRIRAVQDMLKAIEAADRSCKFEGDVEIKSPELASVLMLIGGKRGQDKRGNLTVSTTGHYARVVAKVEAVDEAQADYDHVCRIAEMLSRLIDEVLAAHKSTAQDAWVEVYRLKGEIAVESAR